MACRICSSPYTEEGFVVPLCVDCRLQLSHRRLSRAVKLFCILMLAAITYAGTYYPDVLRAARADQEGVKAEKAGKFPQAIQTYETVLSMYPHCPRVIAHLGISYYRSGNVARAVEVLGGLVGRDAPQDAAAQVNDILSEIKKRAGVK